MDVLFVVAVPSFNRMILSFSYLGGCTTVKAEAVPTNAAMDMYAESFIVFFFLLFGSDGWGGVGEEKRTMTLDVRLLLTPSST